MRIVILHQAVPRQATADERDVLEQARAIRAVLRAAGHAVTVVPCTLDLRHLDRRLRELQPELCFNLVESLGGEDRLLTCVPTLLAARGLSFTGGCVTALFLSTHKTLAKQLLRVAGLPTPDWIEPGAKDASQAEAPRSWLVKSVWDHASAGVHASNLLRDTPRCEAARALEALVAREGGAWFAEAYVEGREFNLSLLDGPEGPTVLPPAEIRFVDFPPDRPHILDYEAKWDTQSFAYTHTPRTFDLAPEDASLADKLRRLALACWKVFGLRGYARVDFRVDEEGRPWILEVNVNPCLAPDAGFAAALERGGLSYAGVVMRIVEAAVRTPGGRGDGAGMQASTASPGVPRAAAGTAAAFRGEVEEADAGRVRSLVASTGFFHDDEVEIAVELVGERLRLGAASGYEFLFAGGGERLTAYSCFGATPCTASSFDLYWIAVAPEQQGCGLGRSMLRASEARIREMGGTRVYAETSSRPQYASTRAFYERCGYTVAGVLDDFYAPGDGRVTYLKVLDGP